MYLYVYLYIYSRARSLSLSISLLSFSIHQFREHVCSWIARKRINMHDCILPLPFVCVHCTLSMYNILQINNRSEYIYIQLYGELWCFSIKEIIYIEFGVAEANVCELCEINTNKGPKVRKIQSLFSSSSFSCVAVEWSDAKEAISVTICTVFARIFLFSCCCYYFYTKSLCFSCWCESRELLSQLRQSFFYFFVQDAFTNLHCLRYAAEYVCVCEFVISFSLFLVPRVHLHSAAHGLSPTMTKKNTFFIIIYYFQLNNNKTLFPF